MQNAYGASVGNCIAVDGARRPPPVWKQGVSPESMMAGACW
jgi:hypothetical protein